jgi:hypothetical protein
MKPVRSVRSTGPALIALAIAACGGQPAPEAAAPPSPPAAPSSPSAAPSAGAKADAPAPAEKAEAAPEPEAPAELPEQAKLGPTKRQRLKVAPFSIALPEGATVKKEDNQDVVEFAFAGANLFIRERSVVYEGPLDKNLKDLAKEKMKVFFKDGSGDSYGIAYQPSKDNSTLQYLRYITVGGKQMECSAPGIFQDSIAVYDAVCKSMQK